MSQPQTPTPPIRHDPLDYFTDREQVLGMFREMLAGAQPQQSALLAVKGNSGVGKSFLLRYIRERVCPELGWVPVSVAFAPQSVPDFRSILSRFEATLCAPTPIAGGEGETPSPLLPRDAVRSYRARRDQHIHAFDEYRSVVTVNQKITAAAGGMVQNSPETVQVYAELREREGHLRDELQQALAELCEELARPVCILVDGYERIVGTDPELAAWMLEEALSALAAHSPHPIAAVVCGWDYPRAGSQDWDVRQKELQDFEEGDIAAYLRRRGVVGTAADGSPVEPDPALVAACQEISVGHPLFLDLACTHLLQFPLVERTPELLLHDQPLLDDEARTSFLTDQILGQLSEPYRQLLERGAVLRAFDKASLKALLPEENELSDDVYERLLAYPFINQATDVEHLGQRRLHPLVRRMRLEALRQHLPDTFVALQRLAYGYYTSQMGEESEEAVVERLYHGLQVPEQVEESFAAWMERIGDAIVRWQATRAGALWRVLQELQEEGWEPGDERQFVLLLSKAHYLELEAHWDEAMSAYQEAIEWALREQVGNPADIALALNNIGGICRSRGELDPALEYFERSLALYEKVGTAPIATLLINIGYIYESKGRFDTALEYYERARKLCEQFGDPADIGNSLNNIGIVYAKKGKSEKALEYYEGALALREQVGDAADIAASLTNIGGIYKSKGELDKALGYCERALAMCEQVGNPATIATLLNNIGGIYDGKGELDTALDYYQRSLALRERVGSPAPLAISLNNIGTIHAKKGESEKALEYYERALALREQVGNPADIAASLTNIGTAYASIGELDKALEYYERARALYAQAGEGGRLSTVSDAIERISVQRPES